MQFCLVCFSALQHHIQYSTVMLHLENLVPQLPFMLIRHFVECLSTGNSLDIVLDIELEFRFEGKNPRPNTKCCSSHNVSTFHHQYSSPSQSSKLPDSPLQHFFGRKTVALNTHTFDVLLQERDASSLCLCIHLFM